MGFFDSLTNILSFGGKDNAGDFLGFSDTGTEDRINAAGINLGNIFLPGGLQGGGFNESPQGAAGFGGSPLNQADWQSLNSVWGNVRNAANFGDISAGDLPPGLSPEASQFLTNNWSNIRRAANLGDINWRDGIVGAPNYATPAGAPGAAGAPATPTSSLGDLEPARGVFANLAAEQAGQVGQNTQGNILELLREQARPQEQSAFNRLNNNLFMRGRLGAEDTATSEAYRGFARGQSEADLARQLSSFGLSDQLQTSALGRSLGAAQGAGALTTLSTLPFDMALRLAQARSQAALGQAGASSQMGQNVLNAHEGFKMFSEGWNNMFGGMAGMSDRRLKTNVVQIGAVKGRPWYRWDWIWGGSSEGVMAQENPDIAFETPSGYLAVDYGRI